MAKSEPSLTKWRKLFCCLSAASFEFAKQIEVNEPKNIQRKLALSFTLDECIQIETRMRKKIQTLLSISGQWRV